MNYDEAVTRLHQSGLAEFVAERKRLAAELKAAGDAAGAARLGKLARPPVSAWVVNQLWWQEPDAFARFFAVAERVKRGEREANQTHRALLAELRERAAGLLRDAGNAASEPTLRRVATTLSAVGALGSFAPDPPGALSADRDPPGFEAVAFAPATPKVDAGPPPDLAAEAARQKALESERRRAEEEARQRRLLERERLGAALRDARALLASEQREVARLRAELATAEAKVARSSGLLVEIEEKLNAL